MKIIEDRYAALYPLSPVTALTLQAVENELNLVLPYDLKQIAAFYSGGYLGGKSHFDISIDGSSNIVTETLRLRRAVRLPPRFVVLAEPPESLIVLETREDSSSPARVIWIDANDVFNLESPNQIRDPDIWPDYASFFSYLLDEEEEERNG